MFIKDGLVYDKIDCTTQEEFVRMFWKCILEAIKTGMKDKDKVFFPTKFALGYSNNGGMALAFRSEYKNFFITWNNDPFDKDKVSELIGSMCAFVKSIFGVYTGNIVMIPMGCGKEYAILVEAGSAEWSN